MYKYLSVILAALLLVLGGFSLYRDYSRKQEIVKLSNALAKSEGMLKETETAYSIKAQELEGLKSSNKELQNKIEKRDEEILALGEIVLSWKNKYFQIKNAKETPVDPTGNPVEVPPACADELQNVRFRVDFEQTQDYLKVVGHTLTNPAYAEVSVEWVKPLKLDITLTKNKNNQFRLYLDSHSLDYEPKISLKIDPSVFERRPEDKIGLGMNLGVGDGLLTSFSVNYELFHQWQLGMSYSMTLDDKRRNYYGLNAVWFPLRD